MLSGDTRRACGTCCGTADTHYVIILTECKEAVHPLTCNKLFIGFLVLLKNSLKTQNCCKKTLCGA